MKLPKYSYALIPQKFLLATASLLVILLIISKGGSSVEVGIAITLSTLGNLFSSLFYPKLVKNHVTACLGGYVGLFIAFLFLISENLSLMLFSPFLLSFFGNFIYFSTIFLLREDFVKNFEGLVGKLESIGGWAWVAGLLFGTFFIDLLGMELIVKFLTLTCFFSIFASAPLLGIKILEKIAESIREDFGLLPLIDRGIEKVTKYQEIFVSVVSVRFREIIRGTMFPSPSYLVPKFPTKMLKFYFMLVILFISFGLVYSQVVTLMKEKGLPNSFIFLTSLLSSVFAAMFYSKAAKVKEIKNILVKMLSLRVIIFLLLILSLFLPPLPASLIYIIFNLIDGYSWAFILMSLNIFTLRISKEEMGISNFVRNLAYMLGSTFSGFIIKTSSFAVNFSLGLIFLVVSMFILAKLRFKQS